MHRNDRGAIGAVAATIGALVLIVAVGFGAWALTVLLAEPVARGEAVKQRESVNNRVFAQQRFEQLNAEVEATRTKITAAEKARASNAEAEIRYQGLVSYCASVVADYNAAARSYSQHDFRAADLPAQLTATDCETTR